MTKKRFRQKNEDDWVILDRNQQFAFAHNGYHAKKIIQELNELVDTNRELYKENEGLLKDLNYGLKIVKSVENENKQIRNTINEMYNNERTELGKSVLKQLIEAIQ